MKMNKTLGLILAALTGLLISVGAQAVTTCTAVVSAKAVDWVKPAAWSCVPGGAIVPPTGANVFIPLGANILVDAAMPLIPANVTVATGGILGLKAGQTMSLSGNFTNNGTFTAPATTTVAFTGTNQTIAGTGAISFANITTAPGTILTLNTNVIVTGTYPATLNLSSTCPANYTVSTGAAVIVGQTCSTAPSTVTSISLVSPNPATSGSAVSWTVVFNQSVTGVTAANFALVPSVGVTGALITSVTGAGSTWTVNANAGSGTGTLGLNMISGAGITNAVTTVMPFVGPTYTISPAPLGAFDGYDTGKVLAVGGGPILTHVEGLAFSVDVVKVLAASAPPTIDRTYRSRITVDVVDASAAGFVCSTAVAVTGATVTPAANTRMIAGNTTYSITVPDAYRDLQLRVTVGRATTIKTALNTTCLADHFAVRPNKFNLPVVSDADWLTPGAVRVLSNITATTVAPIHKAGQPFQLTATAVDALNGAAIKYTGMPDAVVCVGTTTNCTNGRTLAADILRPTAITPTPAVCTGTACAGNPGALTVGVAAVAGVLTANAATYSEAGAFTLQLQDQLFADVDKANIGSLADCSATGRYVCSDPINVGRFVPDHFDTAVSPSATLPMPCPSGLTCPASYNGFVYSGQPFPVQLIAKNANGVTTANYNGVLAKNVTLSAAAANGGAAISTIAPGGTMTTASVLATAFANGRTSTVTPPQPVFTYATAPTAPTDIYVRASDTDGVSSLRGTISLSIEGGVKVVSGRINIANSYGSELLQQPIALTAQFWKDATSTWVASSTDNVTSFVVAAPTLTFGNYQNNLTVVSVAGTPKTVKLAAGAAGFSLSAPGYGATGSVDMTINALPGASCSGLPTPLGCYLPSNTARATFGVYTGNPVFIYRGRRGR